MRAKSRNGWGDTTPATSLPKIGYHEARASWFVLPPDGTICNVGTCTDEEFATFVCLCTQEMEAWRRRDLLKTLALDVEIGRWYVLDEIECHRPRLDVPLFASAEDASRSR